jgi:hypothetical protein
LALLPNDRTTVKTFVEPAAASPLDPQVRETLAKAIHTQYQQTKRDTVQSHDASMRDYDKLDPDLQESNRQQADQIHAKLAAIGMKAVPVTGREIKLVEFTPEQIEILAEMEHARWNVERLLAGWTYGPRDPEKKQSPYLVGWDELPEHVKAWDRDPVRNIPAFLAKVGLEVQPQ